MIILEIVVHFNQFSNRMESAVTFISIHTCSKYIFSYEVQMDVFTFQNIFDLLRFNFVIVAFLFHQIVFIYIVILIM